MNNPIAKCFARFAPLGLPARCALLGLAVLVVFPLAAYVAYSWHGTTGILAAAVAALLCWVGSTAALLLTALLRGPNQAAGALLGGMFFRMGVPLLGGLLMHTNVPTLSEANVFGLVLVFYLVTLVVETCLALPLVGGNGQGLSKVL